MRAVLEPLTRYFFRKENRLLRRQDFLKVYGEGRVFRRRAAHVFVLAREHENLPTQLGITATRKIGGAVERNRLKRQAREIFRLALPELKSGFAIVMNFHRAALGMTFAEIERDFKSAWREAGILQ